MASDNINSINDVYEWYETTEEWLTSLVQILREVRNIGQIDKISNYIPEDLLFATPDETHQLLTEKREHLLEAACMQLFSAYEGTLQDDMKRRRKGRIGKALKKLSKDSISKKAADVNAILDCWIDNLGIELHNYSFLKGAIKYRHWLAHGKYWDDVNAPINISSITPKMLYDSMISIFETINNQVSDFYW